MGGDMSGVVKLGCVEAGSDNLGGYLNLFKSNDVLQEAKDK